MIEERIRAYLPDREDRLIAAVSGGVDSMVLLHVLVKLGCRLVCAHYDHGLRPSGPAEADFVRQAADRLGVDVVFGRGESRAFAGENGLSIEAAARELRYRFLMESARRERAVGVVTAHHADDQVETVLLHLLRGAGARGLGGMTPFRVLTQFDPVRPVLRPLLGTWRAEILAYARAQAIEFMEDESNLDPAFTRNRVRHEIIPALETINPSFKKALLRTAESIREDEDALQGFTQLAWESVCLASDDRMVLLDLEVVRQHPRAVRARLVRMAAETISGPEVEFDRASVDRLEAFLAAGSSSGMVELSGGLTAVIEYDRVWITSLGAELPADTWPQLDAAEIALEPGSGPAPIGRGWFFAAGGEETETSGPGYLVRIRAEAAADGLGLRVRQPGDRYCPAGLEGRTKVSEAMIDKKIPKRLRAAWPLIVSGDRILWVPGCGVDRDAVSAPGENTLILRLFRD